MHQQYYDDSQEFYLEYLDIYFVPDVKLSLDEDEPYEDTETAIYVNVVKAMLKKVEQIKVGE